MTTDEWWLQVDPPDPKRQKTLIGLTERYKLAAPVFDNDDAAIRKWLDEPNKALGGIPPLEAKYADVRDLVGRLQSGVIT